jgi:hypothetical protein
MYPLFIHSQTAPPSKTVHSVFVPQGLGLQTSGLGGGRSSRIHLSKGFPINPGGQVQIGLCLSTTHWALIPQLPGHGSWHWVLIQAKLAGQSSCLTHSGLQPSVLKGSPCIPGKQEQRACKIPGFTVQWVFLPQGEGLQGSVGILGWKHPVNGFPINPGLH